MLQSYNSGRRYIRWMVFDIDRNICRLIAVRLVASYTTIAKTITGPIPRKHCGSLVYRTFWNPESRYSTLRTSLSCWSVELTVWNKFYGRISFRSILELEPVNADLSASANKQLGIHCFQRRDPIWSTMNHTRTGSGVIKYKAKFQGEAMGWTVSLAPAANTTFISINPVQSITTYITRTQSPLEQHPIAGKP